MSATPRDKDVRLTTATPWAKIAGLAFTVLLLIVVAAHGLARTIT